jgi:hypothetical protein
MPCSKRLMSFCGRDKTTAQWKLFMFIMKQFQATWSAYYARNLRFITMQNQLCKEEYYTWVTVIESKVQNQFHLP